VTWISARVSTMGSMPIRSLNSVMKVLLTAKILFGGLDGNVTEQELDLLKLASCVWHT